MRRAMRHAHLLGASEPLMYRLVGGLVAEMGGAYPELIRARPLIEETLLREETRFRQTLEKGLRLLDEATAGMKEGDMLPGETAFRLYDTYGFPYDLTERSEEHTSELQSLMRISYAVFCLKNKKNKMRHT